MVTDIHEWSIADVDHAYQIFSVSEAQSDSDQHLALHEYNSDCHPICSYDHGGHIGQTLVAVSYLSETIPAQNIINSPLYSGFWYSRSTIPNFRPPIV